MRKGSDISSLSNNSNTIVRRRIEECDTIRNTLQSKRHTNIDDASNNKISGGNSAALSLAVETRNAITGMRKKIVKSAIQSPDPDGASEQT